MSLPATSHNESDDEERLEDELRAGEGDAQRVDELRNDEDQKNAVKDLERRLDAARLYAGRNLVDDFASDDEHGHQEDRGECEVENDLNEAQRRARRLNGALAT
jgi:hypothetical protein